LLTFDVVDVTPPRSQDPPHSLLLFTWTLVMVIALLLGGHDTLLCYLIVQQGSDGYMV
jgi:hypothetical protein